MAPDLPLADKAVTYFYYYSPPARKGENGFFTKSSRVGQVKQAGRLSHGEGNAVGII